MLASFENIFIVSTKNLLRKKRNILSMYSLESRNIQKRKATIVYFYTIIFFLRPVFIYTQFYYVFDYYRKLFQYFYQFKVICVSFYFLLFFNTNQFTASRLIIFSRKIFYFNIDRKGFI